MQKMLLSGARILLVFGLSPWLSAQDSPKLPGNGQTQKVVAEGVGATADEAVRDAFRNAVRQVVGAVVDAETLVENDEIITDKVLTYSDGFIKDYEDVPGSKKLKDGLHHIKIKAQVERRNIIAKLEAAKVAMKAVDGKGLFAEAVTQLDAEKDAAKLLQKQFEGFPQSCITATVIGKPEIIAKSADKATVRLTVQIEPDLKAFKGFSGKLIPILEKLAKEKGVFTTKYKNRSEAGFGEYLNIVSKYNEFVPFEWMPKVLDKDRLFKKDQVTVVIATNRTKTANSIDYKYYVLDPSLEPVLRPLASREGQCKLQLLDAEGEIVVTDRFEPVDRPDGYGFYGSLITAFKSDSAFGVDMELPFSMRGPKLNKGNQEGKLKLLAISSVFGNMEILKTKLTISRSLTLSLDELKSIKDVKVEITFDE